MRPPARYCYAVSASLLMLLAASLPAVAQEEFVDKEFEAQWGLGAIGDQYALAKKLTGAGIGVGVVDGIFQTTHPEFAGRIYPYTYNPNNLQNDSHGTHVAGIIGAARNDEGMEGVAPGVLLSPIWAFADDDDLAQGFRGAVSAGLRIFNNSWGLTVERDITTFTPQSARSFVGAPLLGAFNAVERSGGVLVWAAGNGSMANPDVYAGLPYLLPELLPGWITVTAVNQDLQRRPTANACGVTKAFCIAAPGGNIYSTVPVSTYDIKSGTSMAAPHVTGAVAIAKQMAPNASGAQLASLVLRTAKDIGPRGLDDIYGWGLLSVENLVNVINPDNGSSDTNGDGYADDDDGDDNGAVFVNSAYARFAAVDTLVSTLWDRSANRILHQGGTPVAPSVAQAMASSQAVPAMALGGPVRDDVDTSVLVSTGRSAAVWAQGVGAHASLDGTPKSSANLGGAIGGYDLFNDGNLSGGVAIAFTQSDLDTKGTGDDSSAEGWHGFAYATYKKNNWFLDGIAGGNWFSNDYKRTTIGGTADTVLGNQGIAGYSSNDTSGFAGRLTGGHLFAFGPHVIAPYAYATVIHQRTGGSTETGADIFSLDINATSLDQVEGGVGVRSQFGGITHAGFTIAPSVDLAYGRLGGDIAFPVGFELLGNELQANAADVGRDVFRVGAQLDVMRFDDMIGGFLAYDGRFQQNAQNNSFSGGVLVRF